MRAERDGTGMALALDRHLDGLERSILDHDPEFLDRGHENVIVAVAAEHG